MDIGPWLNSYSENGKVMSPIQTSILVIGGVLVAESFYEFGIPSP